MEENRIENYLINHVKKLGGKAYKWVSPGIIGVPDRIVLLPGGRIFFIELKAPGKKPRKLQEYRIKELQELGFNAFYIDSIEKIKKVIK